VIGLIGDNHHTNGSDELQILVQGLDLFLPGPENWRTKPFSLSGCIHKSIFFDY
jgi:hypothetical protein